MAEKGRTSSALQSVVATAAGRAHRDDPVGIRAGGPAGNARLTAWLGLTLLPLVAIELLTLVRVRQLISWHIAVGVLLVPPALAKVATTGWRIARYYTRNTDYVAAGPPPLLLRLLGPAVILSTLGLLGTGLALIALGDTASRSPYFSVAGRQVDAITLHQAAFLVWVVATGLHILTRLLPALQLTGPRGGRLPGRRFRTVSLIVVGILAAVAAVLVLGVSTSWTSGFAGGHHLGAGHRH